jgi:succinyl-diaminopimelate desuccinylase
MNKEHEVLSLAKKLLAIKSLTPHDNGCQELVGDFLNKLGFKTHDFSKNQVKNTLYSIGDGQPHFVYVGHTDVVPAGALELWSHDPFTPTIKDGILYGRGAADMKSSIAAMLVAIKNFCNQSYSGTISVLLTSDEEGDAIDGIQAVVNDLLTTQKLTNNFDYCLIGEASAVDTVGDTIKNGRKGSLHAKLTITGRQGHIAFPERFLNPIHQALPALVAITTNQWDRGSEFFTPTTCQIYRINGGLPNAENVIPQQMECFFNFRFNDLVTVDELKRMTVEILEKYNLDYSLTWKLSGVPSANKSGKLIDEAIKAIKTVTNLDAKLSCAGGTSDARFLNALGCEIIELGAVDGCIHAIDEHIDCNQLISLSKIYENILINLFKS